MMELAFLQEDNPSWDVCRKGKEVDEFISSANSCIKKVKDKNGDLYDIITLQRRWRDFQGNPNNPVFWKTNAEGDFEVIEPKFIPKGSFLQCTGSLRAFKVADKYGVAMDMGRDIIVIYIPPRISI